jgi:ABC-type nitrate/sulfonate/bicarbonate transport system substrate-binding protein
VLYRALARAGIDWRKCRFDCLGGVRQRFDAMLAGMAAATILVPPFDEMAYARGFKVLWDGKDVAPDYPGVVVAAPRRGLERDAEAATAYLGALLDANAWATRPENAPAARAALVAAGYSEHAAGRLQRDAVPGLRPSLAGWAETIALRRDCGLLPQPEPRAEEVINTALLAAAARD